MLNYHEIILDYDDQMWVLNYERWIQEDMQALRGIDENDLCFFESKTSIIVANLMKSCNFYEMLRLLWKVVIFPKDCDYSKGLWPF